MVVDLADVRIRLVGEGLLDEPTELHAGEVGRRLLVRLDLRLEPPELLIFFLDLGEHVVAIPVDLEAELELVLHLLEDVAQRVVRVLEELDRVFLCLEERSEAHRHRREAIVDHHDLVDVLVRERVLASRVVHLKGRPADNGGQVPVVHRVDLIATPADPDLAEAARLGGFDDAVHVDAAGGLVARVRRRRDRALHQTSDTGASWRKSRVSS